MQRNKLTTRYIIRVLMSIAVAVALAGCSDNDDFAPGEASPVADAGVYFSADNPSEYIRTDADAKSISVILERESTVGALTVPISVVSKSDNISDVPSEAVFADGSSRTEIHIGYTDLNSTPQCELSIDERYVNPYKQKDGFSRFALSVYRLKLISNRVTYAPYGGSADYFGTVTSQIAQYEGENKFVWRNFFGSGIDLKFKIDGTFNADDPTQSHGSFIPLDHCLSDADGWYLMTDANAASDGECAAWTPEGGSLSVSNYMYFWFAYDGYDYFSIDLRPNDGSYGYAFIYSAVIDDDSNYNSFYAYIYY